MQTRYRPVIFALILISSLALAACPKRLSVAQLRSNPGRYQDKTVAVAGTVTNSYGVSIPGTGIGGGAYEIDDGTGKIWIITKGAVPAKGARVGVSGQFGTGVSWGGKIYGAGIYEKDRRYPER